MKKKTMKRSHWNFKINLELNKINGLLKTVVDTAEDVCGLGDRYKAKYWE